VKIAECRQHLSLNNSPLQYCTPQNTDLLPTMLMLLMVFIWCHGCGVECRRDVYIILLWQAIPNPKLRFVSPNPAVTDNHQKFLHRNNTYDGKCHVAVSCAFSPTNCHFLLENTVSLGYCVHVAASTPWFEAYREAFLQMSYPSDHEFIRHYLACILCNLCVDRKDAETSA